MSMSSVEIFKKHRDDLRAVLPVLRELQENCILYSDSLDVLHNADGIILNIERRLKALTFLIGPNDV